MSMPYAAENRSLLLAMAASTRCCSSASRAAFCRARHHVHQPVSSTLAKISTAASPANAPTNVLSGMETAAIAGAAGALGVGARLMAVSGIGTRQPGPNHAEMVSVRFGLHVSR